MAGRTNTDGALVELLGEIVGLLDIADFRQGVLEGIYRTIPCKWVSLNEVGPDRVIAAVHPYLADEWTVRFAELAHENPIYQHYVRTLDGRAYRFCDVCSRAALEATRLYREVYSPLGIEYQIAVTLPNERNYVLALVLHREDNDFSDAERDVLNRARPFLIQAYHNALAYSGARAASAEGLGTGLVGRGLTTREAEVVRLVALGASNGDIAAHLELSERTVQKHLERSFRKLGVTNRSAAATLAWELTQQPGPQLMRLSP